MWCPQVLMVCHSSRDVWHDIHMNSRSFISNYLKQFPERAMVKLQRGQFVKTELNGSWLVGRIDTVDASLAKIFFISENRHEWIYRGSTRLHPLFELLANAEARKNQGATRPTHNLAHVHKKNVPYVEYTRGMDADPPHLRPPATQPPAANNQVDIFVLILVGKPTVIWSRPTLSTTAIDKPIKLNWFFNQSLKQLLKGKFLIKRFNWSDRFLNGLTNLTALFDIALNGWDLYRNSLNSMNQLMNQTFLTFRLLLRYSFTQNVVRAVARKSTSKASAKPSVPAVTPPPTPPRVDENYINSEHKGRLKNRWNKSAQEIAFEPHQCAAKCVEEYPYEEGDYKSTCSTRLTLKSFFLKF